MPALPRLPPGIHGSSAGLTPQENHYFGYAIPTTAAADPALETDAPAEAQAALRRPMRRLNL